MQSHPSALLPMYTALARQELGSPPEFELSKYIYIPQEISERRESFRAQAENAETLWQAAARALAPKEEIAFHSRIFGALGLRHIPFLDMGCKDIQLYIPELKIAFRDFGVEKFSVFNSGRSFHIYGHGLLKDDATLIQFMGRLLLLNLPDRERVIDERWVGHRLMAGYLTLRWTSNNPHYKQLPRLVCSIEN